MPGILIGGVVTLPFVTPMSVTSNKPVFAMDTVSLNRLTHSQGAQRWELKASVMPSNNSADFFVHSVVNGHSETFDIRMPQVYRGQNNPANLSSIAASGTAGASTVSISGNSGVLYKGEFVRFTSHNKTYMVTATLNGSGTLSIFPRLLTTTAGSMEHGDTVTFKAVYDTSVVTGLVYTDGILTDPGVLTFLEKIK